MYINGGESLIDDSPYLYTEVTKYLISKTKSYSIPRKKVKMRNKVSLSCPFSLQNL
jgi:hypothetical protein